jgi:hypothetical protein
MVESKADKRCKITDACSGARCNESSEEDRKKKPSTLRGSINEDDAAHRMIVLAPVIFIVLEVANCYGASFQRMIYFVIDH